MSGTLYCRSELSAPWALKLPVEEDCLSFHVVTSGECWLEVEGDDPIYLRPGDLALVPHSEGHCISSELNVPALSLEEFNFEMVSERYCILSYGGGGPTTRLICGEVRFDHPAARRLLELLPRVIHVEAASSPQMDWMQSTLRLMAAEAMELRPGGETVITRLADILVIQAIRSWIQDDPTAQTGWLGALQDNQMGRAITLIHRNPENPWTVASLASEVAMSRSAFAARFTELVGEPAMHYVARWRMHLALSWLNEARLNENRVTLAELASRLGYQSEAAFSRAFKRFNGMSPGAARQHREATSDARTLVSAATNSP
jgi:AraC-like DNA-binding protein